MENLETYLYVFFAVIYIISRIIKARAKQNKPQKPIVKPKHEMQPKPVEKTSGPKKEFSFDNILKDFEKSLTGDKFSEEEAIPVEEIKHEKPAPEAVKTIEEKPNPFQKYKDKSHEFGQKEIKRKEVVIARSEKFRIKENIASEYVKMLRDPEGFKNAVVLSEIINRKYY